MREKKKKKDSLWLSMVSINPLFSPSLTVDLSNHLSGFQSFHDKRIQAREFCRPRLLLFQENLIDLSKCSFFEVLFPYCFLFHCLRINQRNLKMLFVIVTLILWCLVIPSKLISSQYSFSNTSLCLSCWLVSVFISKILNL